MSSYLAGLAAKKQKTTSKAVSSDFSDRAANVLLSAPSLRRREGQAKMLRLVAQVLAGERHEKHAAVEAGTGTGKSLAYLVPVMLHTVETGRRAVVATGTKNLQEQLVKKDVPFAADLIKRTSGKNVTYAVLYGKNNYLCPFLLRRRLAELEDGMEQQESLGLIVPRPAELCFYDRLAAWLEEGSGLKDDLPAWPDLRSQEERDYWWSRVSAADDDADCQVCPETCAFKAAREAAQAANVVIANHHLVAVDYLLRAKAGVSFFVGKKQPPPEVLVLDEAHDFIDAFRSVLEAAVSQRKWQRLEADIRRFLSDESVKWTEENLPVNGLGQVKEKSLKAKEWFKNNNLDLQILFESAREILNEEEKDVLSLNSKVCYKLYPISAMMLGFLEKFCNETQLQINQVLQLAELHTSPNEENFKAFACRAERLKARCVEFIEFYRRAVMCERHYTVAGPEGDACWFDGRRFIAQPVKVGKTLAGLWAEYKHVVATSATLFPFPQSEGFKWFREEYGFTENGIALGVVPSPFNWDEQMRAYVLTNSELEPPSGKGPEVKKQAERREMKLAKVILEVSKKTSGGTLVLFTSYREMKAVAELVRCKIPTDRFLVQGEGGKAELLHRFKEHGQAILFGVASFWQGVDVPGEALSTLIVAKIPFPQPDEPITEALCKLAGREWWQKVYVPLTALTLRQGVGRLIRTEEDSGVVIVTDPRAAGKHRWILRSCLPVEAQDVIA